LGTLIYAFDIFIFFYFKFLFFKLFEPLSITHPNFKDKLVAINGDLLEPKLGICAEDEAFLEENINIVFHSAATVRFDEPLK
jgi:thioester reductase-like protein